MRLIDADALFRQVSKNLGSTTMYLPIDFQEEIMDAPTIDAIPVEWILHIAETLENNGSKNRSGAIRAMVDLWNGEIG